jgi:hypothetical protein
LAVNYLFVFDYEAEISARWQQCLQPRVRQVQQCLYQVQTAPGRNLFVAKIKQDFI